MLYYSGNNYISCIPDSVLPVLGCISTDKDKYKDRPKLNAMRIKKNVNKHKGVANNIYI